MIRLKMIGDSKIAKRLPPPGLHGIVDRNFHKAALALRDAIRVEAPARSGKLRKSIRLQKLGQYNWAVVEGARHGLFIREGAIGHSIYPKRKKALYWSGLPHPIYWTPHPGIRRLNDYPSRGAILAQPTIDRLLKQLRQEVVNEVSK